MIKIVKGDLLKAKEDVIGHQVNCQGVMGSGIALQIKKKYPDVFSTYKGMVEDYKKNGIDLLGLTLTVPAEDKKWVSNLFGQEYYGRDGKQYTDTQQLLKALHSLRSFAESRELSVALPYMIGSDRGGADWKEVEASIMEAFDGYEVTLYKYDGDK
ncbi:macro domain-containing protein [Bacillus mojavensis]